MMDESFPKSKRLLKRYEFDRTFDQGTVRSDHNLVMYIADGLTDRTRLGIVISKHVKKATVRNRFKRVIRAGFRVEYENLPKGYDLVVIPRTNRDLSSKDVRESLRRLLNSDTTNQEKDIE